MADNQAKSEPVPAIAYKHRLMGVKDQDGPFPIECWGVVDLEDLSLVGEVTYSDESEAEEVAEWLNAAYAKGIGYGVSVSGIVTSMLNTLRQTGAAGGLGDLKPESFIKPEGVKEGDKTDG